MFPPSLVQTLLPLVVALSVIASPQGLGRSSSMPIASPSPTPRMIRRGPDNTVKIQSTDRYCMILPRTPHTNIGDSEHPGGMKSYCSASARESDSQGLLPDNFWTEVDLQEGRGKTGWKYIQLTGCINPDSVDRLNSDDSGGQYDSSGGKHGRGNPVGSVCTGYRHYVELVEPSSHRACMRCCDDPVDCPVDRDLDGCLEVIPGNYFNCG